MKCCASRARVWPTTAAARGGICRVGCAIHGQCDGAFHMDSCGPGELRRADVRRIVATVELMSAKALCTFDPPRRALVTTARRRLLMLQLRRSSHSRTMRSSNVSSNVQWRTSTARRRLRNRSTAVRLRSSTGVGACAMALPARQHPLRRLASTSSSRPSWFRPLRRSWLPTRSSPPSYAARVRRSARSSTGTLRPSSFKPTSRILDPKGRTLLVHGGLVYRRGQSARRTASASPKAADCARGRFAIATGGHFGQPEVALD